MFSQTTDLTVVFATLALMLLFCVVIIIVFVANRRHVSQQVKIARMEADYEKELRIAEHEVQERVMANVARELHDNLGQRLTVLKMHVERHKIIHKDIREEIEPITADIDTTISELRQISRSLNSDFLDKGGMITAMHDEIERIRKLNTYTIHWTADEEPKLEKDQRVMMFRIFQETLNNILKHARGKNIYITLQGGSQFMLEVRDDGIGFDVATKMTTGNGAGLNNMIKRAAIANIEGTIESEEGKGTICRFTQV